MNKKLILFSLLVALICNFQTVYAQRVWDGVYATSFATGTGTKSSPYVIETPGQFGYFISQITNGRTFDGQHIELHSDISLNKNVLSVSYGKDFKGSLNGKGHYVYGVNINGYYSSLFYSLSGTLYNISFKGYISSVDDGVIGTINETGIVFNCNFEFDGYSGNDYEIGTITGTNKGQIVNCHTSGKFTCRPGREGRYTDWYQGVVYGLVRTNSSTGKIINSVSNIERVTEGSTYYSSASSYSENYGMYSNDIEDYNNWLANSNLPICDLTYKGEYCHLEIIDDEDMFKEKNRVVKNGSYIPSVGYIDYNCTFDGWYRNGELLPYLAKVDREYYTIYPKFSRQIKIQPTNEIPLFLVEDTIHANYQWYAVKSGSQSFDNWKSTNTANSSSSSKTITFNAKDGDKLSFNYSVSSQQYSDYLNIKLNGVSIVKSSGIVKEMYSSASGIIVGPNTLEISYDKDYSGSANEDKATVSEIFIGDILGPVEGENSAYLGRTSNVTIGESYLCKVTYNNCDVTFTSDIINFERKILSTGPCSNTCTFIVYDDYSMSIIPNDGDSGHIWPWNPKSVYGGQENWNEQYRDKIHTINFMGYKSACYIEQNAFEGYSALKTINFDNDVYYYIWSGAFANCTSLPKLTLPKQCYIRDNDYGLPPFGGCKNLEAIYVEEGNEDYSSHDGVVYDKNMNKIIIYPEGKKNSTFCLPKTVKSYYNSPYPFAYGNTYLKSIEVEEGNTTYKAKDGVLYDNDFSHIICYPEGKEKEVFVVPSTVIPWGASPFIGRAIGTNKYLKRIEVEAGNQYLSSNDGVLYDYYGSVLFRYPAGKPDKTFVLPLKDGGNVISGFEGCDNIEEIIIPYMTNIIFGRGGTFEGLKNLKSLVLKSKSVVWVDPMVGTFSDEDLPTAFCDIDYENATLYVPKKLVDAYKAKDLWKHWGNIIPFDPNTMFIDSVYARYVDKNTTIPLYMDNRDAISNLQFDIELPEGVDIAYEMNEDEEEDYVITKGERAKTAHTVSVQKNAERNYRVAITSTSNATFKDDDKTQPVAYVKLDYSKAPKVSTADYKIYIKNQVLANVANGVTTKYTVESDSAVLTIRDAYGVTAVSADETKGTVSIGGAYESATQDVMNGSSARFTATPKTDMRFVKWTENGEDVSTSNPLMLTINKERSLVAEFAPNKYKITFKVDGAVYSEGQQTYNTTVTKPANPTKTGYTFAGWNGLTDETKVTADATYEAMFTINSYKVTFIADGKTVSESSLNYGATITAPTAPTKEGYTFKSWGEVASTVPAQDVTYTAIYEVNKYNVRFIADGEDVYNEEQEYGSAITAPEAPDKAGYAFIAWGEVASTVPARDVEYTAEYVMVGDLVDDGKLNIGDLTKLVGVILRNEGESLDIRNFKKADVLVDNTIDIGDYTNLVSKILDADVVKAKGTYAAYCNPSLYAEKTGNVAVSLTLKDASDVTAMQFDMTVTDGATVALKSMPQHTVVTNMLDESTMRVLVYSANNATFADKSRISIQVENATKELEIKDIVCATPDAKAKLADMNITLGDATAADAVSNTGNSVVAVNGGLAITSDKDQQIRIYSIAGQLVETIDIHAGETKTVSLTSGSYIVNGQKYNVK